MFKKRIYHSLIIASLAFGLLAALVLTGCSSAQPPVSPQTGGPPGAVQSNSGGSITIEATLLGHQGDSLVFEIAMNTHSVNLDNYDLKQLALLRDDKGSEYSPAEWDSAAGGHHRGGKLVFTHPDQSAKTFELVIRDIAGVSERVFRWQGVTG